MSRYTHSREERVRRYQLRVKTNGRIYSCFLSGTGRLHDAMSCCIHSREEE
jgi:DNA-binding sugar fermentation-stimulating protein